MGSIYIFLFYSWRPKMQRKSVTASQSNQSWWMRNEHQLCHHLWNLGRKWLNMVSTDSCIHQHYFSRVIVDLLFCLFVWRRMKPVDEDINSMATKWSTTAWTHQISAVKTAFTNSSTVTAQMLRPIKETSQLNNCKIVVDGFFWPIPPTRINGKSSATIINKNTIYIYFFFYWFTTP